ncbi:MAG: hypothetical protein AAF330_00935, partial [Pseudomonadota bacterium]
RRTTIRVNPAMASHLQNYKVATLSAPIEIKTRRPSSSAYDFMILEEIKEFRRIGRETTEAELFPALYEFQSQGNIDSLKTKLHDMKKDGQIDWPPRKTSERELTPEGERKYKELWKSISTDQADRIQNCLRSALGDGYCFPRNV